MSLATTSEPKRLSSPWVESAAPLTRVRPASARASSARPPSTPFGSSMTTATSSAPIQKYQYCGAIPEN